jgi:hypothetical protein
MIGLSKVCMFSVYEFAVTLISKHLSGSFTLVTKLIPINRHLVFEH